MKPKLSHNIITLGNISQYDPTRTLSLRNRFASKMGGKFNNLKRIINAVVVKEDIFGLTKSPNTLEEISVEDAIAAIQLRGFQFARDPRKIEMFMAWLKEMEDKGILETYSRIGTIRGIEEAWTDVFVQTAYQQGVLRSRQEMRKQGLDIPTFDSVGGITNYVFNSPFHVNRLGLLFTRTFNELKGITDVMDQQISRVLTQGIAEGRGPREVARMIVDRVDHIGITRARTLARTEIIRAHAEANLEEYAQMGIEGVEAVVEWSTRRTFDVCPECQALEGKYFTIASARGMIPYHPNCRCLWIPILKSELKSSDKVY